MRSDSLRQRQCAVGVNMIPLRLYHLPDERFVIVCLRTARAAALEQPVIPLRIEQAVLIKPGFLEAVIHVRC